MSPRFEQLSPSVPEEKEDRTEEALSYLNRKIAVSDDEWFSREYYPERYEAHFEEDVPTEAIPLEYKPGVISSFEKGAMRCTFSVEKVSGQELEELVEQFSPFYPSFDKDKMRQILERYLWVTDLQITKNNPPTVVFDWKKDAPPGWKLHIDPNRTGLFLGNRRGSCDEHLKLIEIWGNLAEGETLLALLHETGHAVRLTELSEEEYAQQAGSRERFRKAVDLVGNREPGVETESNLRAEDVAEVMRDERGAWAYALRKLKPLMQGEEPVFAKDNVEKYIQAKLQTYENSAIRYAEEGLVRGVGVEYEQD